MILHVLLFLTNDDDVIASWVFSVRVRVWVHPMGYRQISRHRYPWHMPGILAAIRGCSILGICHRCLLISLGICHGENLPRKESLLANVRRLAQPYGPPCNGRPFMLPRQRFQPAQKVHNKFVWYVLGTRLPGNARKWHSLSLMHALQTYFHRLRHRLHGQRAGQSRVEPASIFRRSIAPIPSDRIILEQLPGEGTLWSV